MTGLGAAWVTVKSRGLAPKVLTMVLTLKLTQEPKNEMRPNEVRLQKGARGLGLT